MSPRNHDLHPVKDCVWGCCTSCHSKTMTLQVTEVWVGQGSLDS